MQVKSMISAVLVTLNEAGKIERCLKSLEGFVDATAVCDLGSVDGTEAVCKKYSAKVFKTAFVPFVEKVRNYAVSKAPDGWVLVLDPDEVMTDILKRKLKRVVSEDKYQAVNIPRKNIFFGKWIAHTNWWPDYHVRFFKKGSVKWSSNIHQYPQVSGKVLSLPAKGDSAIVHYGYDSIGEFMDRQNRYSGIEAKNRFESGERFSRRMFFFRPAREFLVRFIRHAGFLDGFYGLALTILMMIYQMQVMIKLWELEKGK